MTRHFRIAFGVATVLASAAPAASQEPQNHEQEKERGNGDIYTKSDC